MSTIKSTQTMEERQEIERQETEKQIITEKQAWLQGKWEVELADGSKEWMELPGTLDENGIGHEDVGNNQWHPDENLEKSKEALSGDKGIATRFTRKYTYEGCAKITKKVVLKEPKEGKRYFLEVERARALRLLVDNVEISPFHTCSISTPYVFEVTECWTKGEHEICFLSDNSYPGMPKADLLYSSAATDETQTNWNGLLGTIRVREENKNFLDRIQVYPKGNTLTVRLVIAAKEPGDFELEIHSEALQNKKTSHLTLKIGENVVELSNLLLRETVKKWDEGEGNLYSLQVVLTEKSSQDPKNSQDKNTSQDEKNCPDEKEVTFGVREFQAGKNARLTLNGRAFFLRGEANCGVFPEEGHWPMEEAKWMEILKTYASYGVNCMRFHSHCPSEAAFFAADKLGMMMQPELSHWNPKDAFESEESFRYYKAELLAILDMLANHPSFVMLTLGNELKASPKGHERMTTLLNLAREKDSTRLYADGSNVHYGEIGCDEASDFYASQKYFEEELRGTYANMEGYINKEYPNACHDYEKAMARLRKDYQKPVFTFEVGQFEILPEFGELEKFQGVTLPVNYRLIQEKVEKKGLLPRWKRYVEATGELSRIGYREEVEAVLRTESLSGISLLGLQDFPGQGTALVGMLDAHLDPKPYEFAKPEHFAAFFKEAMLLVLLPKYTYEQGETLEAVVKAANYSKDTITGTLCYRLLQIDPINGQTKELLTGSLEQAVTAETSKLSTLGTISIPLTAFSDAAFCKLEVAFEGERDCKNQYPIWIYPRETIVCPKEIYETRTFDEKAQEVLRKGGKVLLAPDATKEALPHSIQSQFTTDFWSVGTFGMQEGGMGQLIEHKHPLFRTFPTSFHTDWQWWPMASQRAAILPEEIPMDCAIVTQMDCYAYLRNMVQLMECKIGEGSLLFSTFGLHHLQQYPEARALQASIYRYMTSDAFAPKVTLKTEQIEQIFLQR